jgi:hypothetical protein
MHCCLRPSVGVAVGLGASLLVGCGAQSAPSPAAPTPVGVGRVTIAGAPASFSVGETAQLTATAVFWDAHTQDVTTIATWSTTTLACLVSRTGRVTAMAEGECQVQAAYEGMGGSADLKVGPSKTFRISGVIRERWAPREPPLSGAVVTLTSGPQAGRSTTTGTTGEYRFDGVPIGTLTLRVEAAGFETGAAEVAPDSPAVDVLLVPQQTAFRWSPQGGSARLDQPFDVGHFGPVTLTTFSPYFECGTYETMGASVVAPEGDHALNSYPCIQNAPNTVQKVLGPGRYVLSAWVMFSPSAGRLVEISYPQ